MSISVVIPAYNASRYIAETLESVLKQTVAADEILVVDDGSTDETASIAEQFGLPVRVIRRQNSKLSATRNAGVQEAAGEWIAFIDADDLWESSKLERQMEELMRYPGADLCYTGRRLLIQNEESVRLGQVVKVPPASRIRESLFQGTTFLPSSVVIRRSTLMAVGGFDTKCIYVEDWDLWLRLLHWGAKFVDCQEPLVQYRIHSNSMTSNSMSILEGAEDVYRRLVFPHLSGMTGWLAYNKFRSIHEAYAAKTLQAKGDPRALSMLARSILHSPIGDTYRYKAFARLLYSR
ncbi:MAG: glycosyltransferase family A protein [Edaphobacter sp.]